MAAYGDFAWFYDEFNGEADYQALFDYVHGELEAAGVGLGLGIGRALGVYAEDG